LSGLHESVDMKARKTRPDTLTRLLSCKPLDVELRRLQRAAARSKARLKNKRAK
jgi:hypothetical protein